jgi:hypothetical protein
MRRLAQVIRTSTLIPLLFCASISSAQQVGQRAAGTRATASAQSPAGHARYLRAFVINDRLSALRREPSVQAEVIRRLRLGRTVFIVSTSKHNVSQRGFCRIAVTRRTRGWIHESALAVQGRSGEDQRIIKLIEGGTEGADRITLCRIIIDSFGQSRLLPRAFLLLGEEAERIAETLSQRTRRRLADLRGADASLRDYYLSDAGLDRYSRLGIVFDFNESTGEFIYDGKAYREIIKRFPNGEEAKLARRRLDPSSRKASRER